MDTRPWKRERIINLPRSQRQTEPLQTVVYRVHCGTSYTTNDVFCGMCGALLKEDASCTYGTVPFGLTAPSWQRRQLVDASLGGQGLDACSPTHKGDCTMTAFVLLTIAIVSAVSYPRVKGGARLIVGVMMLGFLVAFLINVVHFAHSGL